MTLLPKLVRSLREAIQKGGNLLKQQNSLRTTMNWWTFWFAGMFSLRTMCSGESCVAESGEAAAMSRLLWRLARV